MKLKTALIMMVLSFLVFPLASCKILSVYYISPLEKTGFCINEFGENYKFVEEKCVAPNEPVKDFSINEFRNKCEKPPVISARFTSDCWNVGRNQRFKWAS